MEGRCLREVAHLARLGVNLVRAGILGLLMKKAARNRCFLYFTKETRFSAGRKFAGVSCKRKSGPLYCTGEKPEIRVIVWRND